LFSTKPICVEFYPRTSPITIAGARTARWARQFHAARQGPSLGKHVERSSRNLCLAGYTTFTALRDKFLRPTPTSSAAPKRSRLNSSISRCAFLAVVSLGARDDAAGDRKARHHGSPKDHLSRARTVHRPARSLNHSSPLSGENTACRKTRRPKLGLSRKDHLVDGARPLKEALAPQACPCGSASRSSRLVCPYSSKRSASLFQCSDIFRRIAARLTETAHP
jgi:hypothetical protein